MGAYRHARQKRAARPQCVEGREKRAKNRVSLQRQGLQTQPQLSARQLAICTLSLPSHRKQYAQPAVQCGLPAVVKPVESQRPSRGAGPIDSFVTGAVQASASTCPSFLHSQIPFNFHQFCLKILPKLSEFPSFLIFFRLPALLKFEKC